MEHSNQEIGENLRTAFDLVRETHRQVEVFLNALDEIGSDTIFENLTPGFFMRYNSDKNRWGWLYSSFVKVFKGNDPKILFSIEINFDRAYEVPVVIYGAHQYSAEAPQKCYPPNGWIFMHRKDKNWGFEIEEKDLGIYESRPLNNAKKEHTDLEWFRFKVIPLLDIERANIKENIFENFLSCLPE